jgi:hypothetical protein
MKRLIFTLAMVIITPVLMAQVPAAFSYQAVVRNNSGEIVPNQTVKFRMTLLRDSETGTPVYAETHSVTTNAFGLASLKVGMGIPESGSIDPSSWGGNAHFLKVELDPENGASFTHLGTVQLLAVPYAFHAKTVENDKVDDADADASNEIQFLTKSGNTMTLSQGGGSVTDAVDDADHDATNEIQALSLSGTMLSLSRGGGSVTLPSSGGGDNWGTQAVVTNPSLAGNGTTATPLLIADNGVTTEKILDGTIGNADLANNAVNGAKVLDGSLITADLADQTVSTAKLGNLAVSADKIQNSAVTTDKLAGGSVTGPKIAQAGATTGQVLKWSGSTWAPSNDLLGSCLWNQSGTTLYYSGGNVKIGTLSGFTGQLQVQTAGSEVARFESAAASNWISLNTNGVRKGMFWINDNTLTIRGDEGVGINFKTDGNNERLAIETDGDITTPATGTNRHLLPVAYGYVNQMGVLNTAKSTTNVTATVTGSAGTYNYIVTIN